MPPNVPAETYQKYRDQVLRLSLAIQTYRGDQVDRTNSSLSDREIARRLNLDEETVREIRCIAQIDTCPVSRWEEAESFKNAAWRSGSSAGSE